MGGITLVDTSANAEYHATGLKSLSHVEALNQLAIDASALTGQTATQIQHQSGAGSFSISDFLVPGLQSKAWEDWQVADELNPFATGMDSQDFTTDLNGMPFHFGLDGMLSNSMWDTTTGTANLVNGLSTDQAYDEYVFDLAPSNFATPATVNIADLIVGPNSLAPSVSPLDLAMPTSMPTNFNNYQDLALASLYGFTEQDESGVSDSDLGSDLSEVDSSSDEDEDDEHEDMDDDNVYQYASDVSKVTAAIQDHSLDEDLSTAVAMSLATRESSQQVHIQEKPQQHQPAMEDPNKRRMEEALAARIGNDLGPEHMAGLFKILKGTSAQENAEEDDDEEMEVDLSRLDEATLVELYQYVETCCMQTMGSILAAEEQERQRVAAAKAEAKEEQDALERTRYQELRTPELSPSHSASSASPSPPHPSSSSSSYNVNGCGSSNNKKRSAAASTSCTTYYERSGVEEQTEALWMAAQHKSKRKRVNNNSPVCMGGGGTGKGRRIQKSFEELQGDQDQDYEEDFEIGEDDEIDIVGI